MESDLTPDSQSFLLINTSKYYIYIICFRAVILNLFDSIVQHNIQWNYDKITFFQTFLSTESGNVNILN